MKNPVWRALDEGSQGIRGWGVVRDDAMRRKVIWAPIPLHILFRHAERWYWWIACQAGLKKRLDCPCCGQRYARFQYDTPDYVINDLRANAAIDGITIVALRLRNEELQAEIGTLCEELQRLRALVPPLELLNSAGGGIEKIDPGDEEDGQ